MPSAILAGSLRAETAETPSRLDLRLRRDVQSRRMRRLATRRVARVLGLVVLDVLAVTLAVIGVNAWWGLDPIRHLPLLIALSLFGQAALQTYGAATARRSAERAAVGVIGSTAFLAAFELSYDVGLWTHAQYVVFSAAAWLTIFTGRLLADRFVEAAYRSGIGVERVLVIGGPDEEREVTEHLRAAGENGLVVVGHLDPEFQAGPGTRWIGSPDRLHAVLEGHEVDRVIVCSRMSPARLRQVVTDCFLHGASVSTVPTTLASLECRVSTRAMLGWPTLELEVPRLHLAQLIAKRTLDIVASAVALMLLAPLFLGLALAVKLDSPGPIFFRQRRLGVGGRPFWIVKFRSMRLDAEQMLRTDPLLYQRYLDNGFKLPLEVDPRISSLGGFLRRSSLDELPQLLNVLLGDMSLVGPRPIVPEEIREYGHLAPTFLGVKPGLTGHWQVSGRSSVAYPERAELDISYIQRWSIGLDLKILLLSVPAVLRREGAH